jgi:hypothetical protein
MARPQRRRRGLAVKVFLILAGALVWAPSSSARTNDGPTSFLDNGKVRIGVDLAQGGKITYLAALQGSFRSDLLQDSQQSYSGGPPDAQWHVSAGYGTTVLANRNDGHTIYTKVIPQQEYPFYKQCECTFETWITLDGNAVHVHNRLTNFRSDGANFTPHWQELPALYTTGDTYRLYTYDGNEPYTAGPVREITDDRGGFFQPGPDFLATEHWAALVNDEKFGLGLFEPRIVNFAGTPGNDYAVNWSWINGYMAASTNEILGPNAVFTYDYTLIVGSLDSIRGYAVTHRPDARPTFLFRSNRQHWWEANASDGGDPIQGSLRIYPDRDDSQLYGPTSAFPARSVRVIYLRGAWHTRENEAQLFWRTDAGDFSEGRSYIFHPDNDGRFHTYLLPVSQRNEWTGTIEQLRFDPIRDAEPGSYVDIACISWKPCPRSAKAERRLASASPGVVFQDSFDSSYNPSFWFSGPGSPGTSTGVQQGRLVITAGADAAQAPDVGYIATGISSQCRLAGNFDIGVSYRLLEWPPANGVNLDFGADTEGIGRLNSPNDVYFSYSPSGGTQVPTTDVVGTLRLVRKGKLLTGYYRTPDGWRWLWAAHTSMSRASVQLSISSTDAAFAHQEVQVAFDDFRVMRGKVVCP